MATESKMTIIDVSGPFREPREPIFSYDYSVQRPTWATPGGIGTVCWRNCTTCHVAVHGSNRSPKLLK